jgi:hypothetical protein
MHLLAHSAGVHTCHTCPGQDDANKHYLNHKFDAIGSEQMRNL